MPATAEKYDIDFEETIAVAIKPRTKKRGARPAVTTRASSPARWNQMESLVEHFGDSAVAEPMERSHRKSRVATSKPEPIKTPRTATQTVPRRAVRHRPLKLTFPAIVMWGTICALTLLLLGINGATLALSQHDALTLKQIKISQEAIDNSNKSIASIQVSPETAQWAIAHGWHIADQADFDEVPATLNTSAQTGGTQ